MKYLKGLRTGIKQMQAQLTKGSGGKCMGFKALKIHSGGSHHFYTEFPNPTIYFSLYTTFSITCLEKVLNLRDVGFVQTGMVLFKKFENVLLEI